MTLPNAGVKTTNRRDKEIMYYLGLLADGTSKDIATVKESVRDRIDYGVVSGLEVTETTPASLGVKVASGVYYSEYGTKFTLTESTAELLEAPTAPSNRIDIIAVDSDGTIKVYEGFADPNPVPFDLYKGDRLAEVYVAGGATSVTNANITDKRRMLQKPYDAMQYIIKMINEKTSYGIVSGFTVTQQDPLAMAVDVAGGIAYMPDKKRYELEADEIAITAADTTNPRKDIIYLDSSGVISYLAGTAAASPIAPDVPEGGQAVAEIAVAANETEIETSHITDKRKLF